MFDHDYRDLNHDGKVSDFERWNDYDDFKKITANSQKYGSTKPTNTGGFFNWLKWQGCSTWIIGLLIALSIPAPIGPVLLVIIGIVFLIMLITA